METIKEDISSGKVNAKLGVDIKSVNEVIDEKLSEKKFFLTSVGPKGSKVISKNINKKLNLN